MGAGGFRKEIKTAGPKAKRSEKKMPCKRILVREVSQNEKSMEGDGGGDGFVFKRARCVGEIIWACLEARFYACLNRSGWLLQYSTVQYSTEKAESESVSWSRVGDKKS